MEMENVFNGLDDIEIEDLILPDLISFYPTDEDGELDHEALDLDQYQKFIENAKRVISTIYGVDLLDDNVESVKHRIKSLLRLFSIQHNDLLELLNIVDNNFVQVDISNPVSGSKLQWPEWLIEKMPDSYWLSYELPSQPSQFAKIDHEYTNMLLKRIMKASENNPTILNQLF